jgi:signal transduction histidine kinase
MYTFEARILITIIIAAGVLALVLGFFVLTIIRHQKRKMASEKEKLAAELLLLENERGRIAADLHDELGSLISSIKLNLECLGTVSTDDALILEKTGRYIDTTMQKIREISNNLMPQVLQQKGLLMAIREFSEMVGNTGLLAIRLDFASEIPAIEPEKEIHIYRTMQEIINNTVRHSGASQMDISCKVNKEQLVIDTIDNGNGFDKEQIAQGKHAGNGMRNIVRRVELLKGSLYLETAPGKGVHYTIEIPLMNTI